MKAILINDTSDQGHPGCDLVTKNIRLCCKNHNIELIDTVLHNEKYAHEKLKNLTGKYDIILLNGEGTMHSDRTKAINLMKLVKDLKTPKILFNTVWQNNIELNQYLRFFDKIFVRESCSLIQIKQAGYKAEIVPDMVFYSNYELNREKSESYIVTDCVRTTTSSELFKYSHSQKCEYIAFQKRTIKKIIKKYPIQFLKSLLAGKFHVCQNSNDFIESIRNSKILITGRFHGACIALSMGIPVACIKSNTHKIEGLFKDINLPSSLLLNDTSSLLDVELIYRDSINQMTKIEEYVTNAKIKITNMFINFSEK